MFKEAIAEHEKAVALLPEIPLYLGHLGNTYGLAGKKTQALKVIEQLKEQSKRKYVAPYDIALVYIGLGDKDQAFAWLEKGYQAHSNDMSNLKADPTFDPLRSDPRFQDLLRRMNFPP
jgi:tetratricopeptide (TPR) repeat protein